jgi:hypothetical protein
MRILLWHVHGTWTTAFVQGGHEYLIPVLPGRPPDGRGRPSRPGTFDWPANAAEVAPDTLRSAHIDVAIAQRPEDLTLIERWTGRRPGRDLPTVYVEHNTPPRVGAEHVAAGSDGVTVVHVTHFNARMWNCAGVRTEVIEHGLLDPGELYTGELARAVSVINEPARRGAVAGTDIVQALRADLPLDLFGMRSEEVGGEGELDQHRLFGEMARRRVYLHPNRWTSLGLSLVEAMALGMPVVALAATAAPDAVPDDAGVVTCDMTRLRNALCTYLSNPDLARRSGEAARRCALRRFSLERFLGDWDRLLEAVGA